jgi:hypothetical protein
VSAEALSFSRFLRLLSRLELRALKVRLLLPNPDPTTALEAYTLIIEEERRRVRP